MLALAERPATLEPVTDFVRAAIERGLNAKNLMSEKEWSSFAAYEGPVVSGNPEGKVPDNLEDDDNE